MRSLHLTANRLRHHLLEWGSGERIVLLLHGFLEHAHVWELAAPRLAAAGLHVYALDWRGHGDSEWVGAGGYYHFADYVADLDGIVRGLGGRAALVAHSMGGNAAVLYAGTMPERVRALVSIEGLGPPDSNPAVTPERYATWIADVERTAARVRPAFSAADGLARMRERYPRMSETALALLYDHGTRAEGEGRVWKFDPLHQSRSPQPYYAAQGRAFWQRVTCPVLYVEGDESWVRLPDLDERLDILRAERATIRGSAHHPQLEQPEALVEVLLEFLGRTTDRSGGL
jgi:pimeloyl-ACP methyl ester carboxylesterase